MKRYLQEKYFQFIFTASRKLAYSNLTDITKHRIGLVY